MPPLLQLDDSQQARESARARDVEEDARRWRRTWHLVYAQCLVSMALGYIAYGWSWGLRGNAGLLLSAIAFVLAYALPFFRMIFFFVRHEDQF